VHDKSKYMIITDP